MPVRSAQAQIFNVRFRGPQIARNPCPHADHLRTALNLARHHAGQGVGEHVGDSIRIRAFQARLDSVDLDVEGITGQDDARLYIHDPGNFLNRSGYRRSKFSQKIAIIGIQLDLDRLRHRGKVADEILHQLRQLDLQPGTSCSTR